MAVAHASCRRALFHLEDLNGAIAHEPKAVKLDLNAQEIRFNLGWALFFSKSREEAECCFQKTIALDPSHAEGHLKLALAGIADRDRDGAQLNFDQAATLSRSSLKTIPNSNLSTIFSSIGIDMPRAIIDGEAHSLIAYLEMVRDALPGDWPHDRVFPLGDTQIKLLGETYGALHLLPECPTVEGPRLISDWIVQHSKTIFEIRP